LRALSDDQRRVEVSLAVEIPHRTRDFQTLLHIIERAALREVEPLEFVIPESR
jgi:hypothetical protein